MAFQGDVGQIGLADVLGNIAANQLVGTLHVSSERGEAFLAFEGGAVRGFSRGPGKALSGEETFKARVKASAEDIDAHIKKKRRTKKSWADFVEAAGIMSADEFRGILSNELTENAVEIFFWSPAKFDFVPGNPGAELFGEDFGVVLDVNSLIMEAARRRDHWEMIHKVIATPEDVFVRRRSEPPEKLSPLQHRIWELSTGALSVKLLEKETRATRFATFDAVSELVRGGHLRALSGDEMVRLGEEHIRASRTAEAIRIFRRALDTEHANVGVREKLADAYIRHGEPAKAAGEFKMLAHRASERGELAQAVALYKKAVGCAPDDAAAREKLVQLLRDSGQKAEASASAMDLAAMARKMLLHDRALAALDIAVELNPTNKAALELRLETLLSLGRKTEAIRQLESMAERVAWKDDEVVAILERAVRLEPARNDLKAKIQDIKSGRRNRRRALVRKLLWGTLAMVIIGAVGFLVTWEMRARFKYDAALHDAHLDIVQGHYSVAVGTLWAFYHDNKWSLAGLKARDEAASIKEAAIKDLKQRLLTAPDEEKKRLQIELDLLEPPKDKAPGN